MMDEGHLIRLLWERQAISLEILGRLELKFDRLMDVVMAQKVIGQDFSNSELGGLMTRLVGLTKWLNEMGNIETTLADGARRLELQAERERKQVELHELIAQIDQLQHKPISGVSG